MAIYRLVSPTRAGSTCSDKCLKKVVEKWKMMPKELRWQVWWVYEGARWGLKSKMLVFHVFYHYFLKGRRRPEHARRTKWLPSRGGFEVRKWDFWLNVSISKNVFLPAAGSTFSQTNIMKTCHRKMKNVAQIMSDTSKYHHNGVGCIKMSLKLCRIHH